MLFRKIKVGSELESENRRLREENRRLLMEREILKKVAPGKVRERGMCHDVMI